MLINSEGHLKCIDFGTAKFLDIDKRSSELYSNKDKKNETIEVELDPSSVKRKFDHRSTFVGTAQYKLFLIIFKLCKKNRYVSPEMLEESTCDAPADLWAFGILFNICYLISM